MEKKVEKLENVDSKESMSVFIDRFRILASNNRNNKSILDTVETAIQRCNQLDDPKSLVKLLEIKISQIEHSYEKHQDISSLIQQMKDISTKIDYMGGLSLAYYKEWYLEKYKNNKERSIKALKHSMNYVKKYLCSEQYEYNVCLYSFAVENWLSKHDYSVLKIFEDCGDYFLKNGYYRSFTQTLAISSIIYTTMQNGKRILAKCRKLFETKSIFEKLPLDVKGFSYYLTGLGYMMDMNLSFAESLFQKAYEILKPIYKESIYYSNFIILHSHLITVKALQGKIEQTQIIINEVEMLLEQEFFERNLDFNTKKQIQHTLNLNKFYIFSRQKSTNISTLGILIDQIFEGSKTLYSNFILLSEFILNSDLETKKLEELLVINSFCTNRVKHIIDYELLSRKNRTSSNELAQKRLELLDNRTKDEILTFTEDVFVDLLIAQQLYSLRRFAEIYPLLRKYEKRLNRIQVLELRIFMEAFIQIGAYKNGDPLGPALQYMAIKKCQEYGFSRLENKLLDYLFLQGSGALKIKG